MKEIWSIVKDKLSNQNVKAIYLYRVQVYQTPDYLSKKKDINSLVYKNYIVCKKQKINSLTGNY